VNPLRDDSVGIVGLDDISGSPQAQLRLFPRRDNRLALLLSPVAALTGDWSKRPLCPDGQRPITFNIYDDGQSGSWTCGIRLNH